MDKMIRSRALTLAAIVVFAASMLVFGLALRAHGRDFTGKWAQSPQADWYKRQMIPDGTRRSCCSIYDAVEAEEEIRGNELWARFTTREGERVDWVRVPNETILPENHNGAPVVWYGYASPTEDDGGGYFIRCFARGTRV